MKVVLMGLCKLFVPQGSVCSGETTSAFDRVNSYLTKFYVFKHAFSVNRIQGVTFLESEGDVCCFSV